MGEFNSNNLTGGTMVIELSPFSVSHANNISGAIVKQSRQLVMRDLTFRNNRTNGSNGAAIFGYGPTAVIIEGSSFTENYSITRGGAVSITGRRSILAPMAPSVIAVRSSAISKRNRYRK